jgi:hypothetical protein
MMKDIVVDVVTSKADDARGWKHEQQKSAPPSGYGRRRRPSDDSLRRSRLLSSPFSMNRYSAFPAVEHMARKSLRLRAIACLLICLRFRLLTSLLTYVLCQV